MTGLDVTGRMLNLSQLQGELGVSPLGTSGSNPTLLFTYDAEGEPADLPAGAEAIVDAHVAMRDKTDAEYSEEFQAAGTTAERKQEIRDITAGLLPREQVPMTQEYWNATRGVMGG